VALLALLAGALAVGWGSLTASTQRPFPGHTQRFTYATGSAAYQYIVYTPASYRPGRAKALVVVLHGCGTTAQAQMQISRYNPLADRQSFVVLYPDLDATGVNAPGGIRECWRFGAASSWQRGGGDAAAIAGMTRSVIDHWHIDRQRVYLAGISAGGFMTTIMAATYPDLYAAVAVAAGGAYRDSSCLGGETATLSAEQSAQLAFAAEGPRARVVPILVMGGDSDGVVPPMCADKALAQGLMTDNLVLDRRLTAPISLTAASVNHDQVPGGRAYTVSTYRDVHRCVIAQRYLIAGMGHSWPGGAPGPKWAGFSDPSAPSAAQASWAFFARFRKSATADSCGS
jgi:poly(hydroxyalkanoate) depolymerase family esterase